MAKESKVSKRGKYKRSQKTRVKNGAILRERWKNPEYRQKMLSIPRKGWNKNKQFVPWNKGLKVDKKQYPPIEDRETLIRLAIKHKPFWDINNGQLLCQECHYKKTYPHIKNLARAHLWGAPS